MNRGYQQKPQQLQQHTPNQIKKQNVPSKSQKVQQPKQTQKQAQQSPTQSKRSTPEQQRPVRPRINSATKQKKLAQSGKEKLG